MGTEQNKDQKNCVKIFPGTLYRGYTRNPDGVEFLKFTMKNIGDMFAGVEKLLQETLFLSSYLIGFWTPKLNFLTGIVLKFPMKGLLILFFENKAKKGFPEEAFPRLQTCLLYFSL